MKFIDCSACIGLDTVNQIELLALLVQHDVGVLLLANVDTIGTEVVVVAIHLLDAGVKEPEAAHIRLLESLVFSENPSAKAAFLFGKRLHFHKGVLLLQRSACRLLLQRLPAAPGWWFGG